VRVASKERLPGFQQIGSVCGCTGPSHRYRGCVQGVDGSRGGESHERQLLVSQCFKLGHVVGLEVVWQGMMDLPPFVEVYDILSGQITVGNH
jgi:hypothetical protein